MKKIMQIHLMVCFAMLFIFFGGCRKASVCEPPVNLTCEHQSFPLGVDVQTPRFSWELNEPRRAVFQGAYQVRVSTSPTFRKRKVVWDSGRVPSRQSVLIPYAGEELRGRTKYFWQVRVWDTEGNRSDYSTAAWFETGIVDPGEWKAVWIGKPDKGYPLQDFTYHSWIWHPSPEQIKNVCFLRVFEIPAGKKLLGARMGITADNEFTLYVNGIRIGGADSWNSIHIYDVLKNISPGANTIAVSASAMVPEHKGLLATLQLYYDSGEIVELFTDNQWKTSGTRYQDWNMPGFRADGWANAVEVASYGTGYWDYCSYAARPARSVMMRKEIEVGRKMKEARAYVTGLGSYVLYINGKRVGEDILSPGWTHYPERIQYQVYDVSQMLREGTNTLGAILGNGWWNSGLGWGVGCSYTPGSLKFMMQLVVRYNDGTEEVFVTDESWKVHDSPIIENTLYHGETYDARLEQPGWSTSGFADTAWDHVRSFPPPQAVLSAEPAPSIQVTGELAPVSLSQPRPGVYVFDMGQNMVGWVKIMASGQRGDSVRLRFAEVLNEDGSIYTESLRTARATDCYIFRGDSLEVWEPMFTYHGFRYVEMTHYKGTPSPEMILGVVFHSAVPLTGTFTCSNELLNKIQQNLSWSLRGNLHSVPTDCPQRDERLGWMGDAQAIAATASYNLEMISFFKKWLRDIRDSQNESGFVYDVNPAIVVTGPGKPAWADALVTIPWDMYTFYGDTGIIRDNFDAMLAWVRYMQKMSKDSLYEFGSGDWGGYGDWVAAVPSPTKPTGALYYYHSTNLLSRMAEIIGEEAVASELRAILPGIANAYNRKYYDPDNGQYEGKTQAMNLLPLAFNMVPGAEKERVVKNIAGDVINRDYHLTTGFLGTKYLCPLLSRYGYHDLAYKVATQITCPSWGYMIEKDATTIWELWNSDTVGPDMNSRNHFALGTVGEWFYASLAGIRPVPEHPGFKQSIIEPCPAGDLTWVDASCQTPYGMLNCHWELNDSSFTLILSIPANTSASVRIPLLGRTNPVLSEGETVILDKGQPATGVEGVTFRGIDTDRIILDVGSGDYHFILK